MEIRNNRILITGGAGLVGSCIVDLLIERGAREIIIFDKFSRGTLRNLTHVMSHPSIKIIESDIRDAQAVTSAMQGVDLVFHQAAIRVTQCAEDPRLALEVLVDGTFNILEAAVKAGVKKVIAASSAALYGAAELFPTPETQAPYPNRTFYGASKAFNEGMLRAFHDVYGLNYVALRYFNVYGPRMDIDSPHIEVMIRWMEKIAAGKPPLIFGDGKQTMDFVYGEDVARANILAALSDITDESFNVGSGVETSLNELAHLLLKVMDSDLKLEYGPERKVNPVPRRLADTQKARHKLGFNDEISLEKGLRRLVEWWKQERIVRGERKVPAAATGARNL